MQPDDSIRELAKKTAKSIVDHGSIPMATLKESIILQEKVDELLAKEIEFPEQEPFPEIPEVDLTPVIDKLDEILTESKKKDLLEYDLQIDEDTRNKLKGDRGDTGPSGKDGIDGLDGKDGADGIDGKDGSPDTPEEIVNKLESLKDESRLDVKAIKGIDKVLQSFRETIVQSRGVKALANLFDVSIVGPTNGQVITYDSATQSWRNTTPGSGAGVTLKTNGSANATQSVLDLKQGTNVTIVDDGLGGITINATGGSGSGDMVLASAQTNSGAKTFLDATLLLRNVANTISSKFTNTATVARTWTMKDADGTVAFTSDITGINSGTNTGDITLAGTPNYITIAGQVITRALIDLTTHVTGLLPFSNIANVATSTVMYRKTAGTGSIEAQTLATLKTDLGLTGTNSGDQTSIVGITGTIAQFNTACTDADFATGGGTATGTNTGDNAVNTLYSGLATSKQDTLTLTTTGTSGAATLVGATLNIPQYSGGGGGTTITTQDEGSTLSTTVTTLNFTGAGVTASGAGATTTINIPGGGGGSVSLTSSEIDFGTTPASSKTFTITDAGVSSTNKIIVFKNPTTATGRVGNDWEMDMAEFSATAGTGNFTVAVLSPYKMVGARSIYYQII